MKKHFRLLAVFFLSILLFALFSLPANAQTPQRYDAAQEGILSEYYRIDQEQGYITGIAPGTSVQKLLDVCTPSGITVSAEEVVTGTELRYLAGDRELCLTAIVSGDLNGDGAVTVSDMLIQKDSLLGRTISPVETAAGDINGDGKLTVTDFLSVKACLLGLEDIDTSYTGGDLFLLEPGKAAPWQVSGAYGYMSDDPTIFTVDDKGTVTAAQEGSAFLYALAEDGSILARQLVTVLAEPLSMSLGMESCKLIKGQSMTVTPKFNHPVTPHVTWTTSDPSVVSVENGSVTGVKFGTATVTATLDSGLKAELSVAVIPPVEEVRIERQLYKIKPGNSWQIPLFTAPAESGEVFLWSSSDPNVASVSPDGTVTGLSYGTVTITATGKYSRKTASCQLKVCDVIQVAITFDDGPSSHTVKLLDYLKEKDIRATFFTVGERLGYYSEIVKREAAEGHELAYHSYDHSMQPTLSSDRIFSDFQKSQNILYNLTGKRYTLWRTPGGDYNERVLSCVPLPHIMWSLDTRDWEHRNTYSVYNAIRKARDGDIILLHDLYGTTVEGAIMAMDEMLAGDYEFLTVTELISRNGTPPQKHQTYGSGR